MASWGRWHTSPFSVRFVRALRHHLAPQHARATCMIELPFVQGTLGAWDLLRYYERRFVPQGARPHWGQATFALSYESTAAAHSKFDAFIAGFERFNPRGTFDNSFTQRLSLRAAAGGVLRRGARTTLEREVADTGGSVSAVQPRGSEPQPITEVTHAK
jgi:hypothetical protein